MNIQEIIIRDAKIGDEYQLAELSVVCWRQTYLGLMDDLILESMNIDELLHGFAAALRSFNTKFLVAELHGKLLGFISYGSSRIQQSGLEIYAFYIDRNYQGMKIGSSLLRAAEGQIRISQVSRLWVCTLSSNVSAQEFYIKNNFVMSQLMKSFCIQGFSYPEFVMYKVL